MHLTGEADALDGRASGMGFTKYALDSSLGSAPPVVGILLGPEGTLHANFGM
jgi:hypothetical protein